MFLVNIYSITKIKLYTIYLAFFALKASYLLLLEFHKRYGKSTVAAEMSKNAPQSY